MTDPPLGLNRTHPEIKAGLAELLAIKDRMVPANAWLKAEVELAFTVAPGRTLGGDPEPESTVT